MLILLWSQTKDTMKIKGEFTDIEEIQEIVASANMGIWRIELVDGQEPRMYVDKTMKELLGISGMERTPEKTYTDWFAQIKPEAVSSVYSSVERMEQGYFDENTYLWIHPTKGERYVRCGGTAHKIEGGFCLRGYHYDVDDIVRMEQEQATKLKNALDDKKEYYATLGTLAGVFYSMHVIDLVENTATEFNSSSILRKIVNHQDGAVLMMKHAMGATISDEHKERALEFTNLTTLSERMKGKKIISSQFLGKNVGWILSSFITMEKDEEERPTKVIYTTRIIDEQKKQEEKLIKKAQTDELTGLYNRRAYEDDLFEYNNTPKSKDFIYVSFDVNGLKVVNDTLGHTAGDELIIGACQCMQKSFGAYGKVYRIGGDEFAAIIFCSQEKIKEVIADFEDTTAGWSGKLIDSLSISYGYVSKVEQPTLSIRELGAIAEQRMYEMKDSYYKKLGFDRRGQKDAHKALCDLYTKILKINITDDSYQIINMDLAEQIAEKGFEDTISGWFKSFGATGHVHPDDLDEYMKKTNLSYLEEYFSNNKTSLHILYRRKYSNGFKQVMMEIIPANDYKDDNRTFFLYVKNIDA